MTSLINSTTKEKDVDTSNQSKDDSKSPLEIENELSIENIMSTTKEWREAASSLSALDLIFICTKAFGELSREALYGFLHLGTIQQIRVPDWQEEHSE